jgi:2-methylcitrate dehydratase PrpD
MASSDAIFQLAEFCVHARYEQLPAQVVQATKIQIMDTLGGALPAAHLDGICQLRQWTQETGGAEHSLVWGSNLRVPVENAARLNAAMAHALEFDDTYERSLLHASVVTVATALSVADWVGGVSGQQFITAVAIGTDIACRLARAGSPGVSPFVVGWDPTPMYGYLSAAFVAGKLMGLSREQLVSAAGLAYQQIAGNAQASIQGTHAKRMGPGYAASAGIMAARLAQQGVEGGCDVLEGVKGLYQQYHGGRYGPEELLGGLGASFAGPDIAPKPYPSCRGGHCGIDAALALRLVAGVQVDTIDKVIVHCAPAERMLLGMPLEKKQAPRTIVEAQFSLPWVVAAALTDGEVTLAHFSAAALERADLQAMARRIETAEDKSLVRIDGGPGAVRVEVWMVGGGECHVQQVSLAKGDPAQPMTPAEYRAKFLGCADVAGMPRMQSEAVLQRILELESEVDMACLTAFLAVDA